MEHDRAGGRRFPGPLAMRRVGDYVRRHGDAIEAFYASNVAVYLTNQQKRTYCLNLATLRAARRAWFIDRDSVLPFASKLKACGSGIAR